MDLGKILHENAKILVAGLGYRTGLMTSNFLAERNFSVHVCDVKTADALSDITANLNKSVKVFSGTQDVSLLENNYDLIVLSPGVPAKIDLISEAKMRGIPVIAEVELAYHFTKGFWIAITGTDGKSTTTAMTGHVLQELYPDSRIGGNIGIPLISLAEKSNDKTVTVAELSSFQLETIENFRADIAVITNIAPDHLDRYESMLDYFDAKMNIIRNQSSDDFFILNEDDEMICAGTENIKAGKLTYSLKNNDSNVFYKDESVYYNDGNNIKELFKKNEMFIPGMHNIQNAMMCFLIMIAFYRKTGQSPEIKKIVKCITSFKGLEHRMEIYKTYRGRRFINDSKATTVGAAEVALKSLDKNSIFILGGRGKGDDYSRLALSMKDNVRGVVLIGETQNEFEKIFSAFNYVKASTMEMAVKNAYKMSSEGDTIILSPATASFDMYNNFEERGKSFKHSVDILIGEGN